MVINLGTYDFFNCIKPFHCDFSIYSFFIWEICTCIPCRKWKGEHLLSI